MEYFQWTIKWRSNSVMPCGGATQMDHIWGTVLGFPFPVKNNWWSISGEGMRGIFSEDHNWWSNSGMPCGGATPVENKWWTVLGFPFPVKHSWWMVACDSECTIAAMEKTGGLLRPYFRNRVVEVTKNLSELSETTVVEQIQQRTDILNPADVPTRTSGTATSVSQESQWITETDFLHKPRSEMSLAR